MSWLLQHAELTPSLMSMVDCSAHAPSQVLTNEESSILSTVLRWILFQFLILKKENSINGLQHFLGITIDTMDTNLKESMVNG